MKESNQYQIKVQPRHWYAVYVPFRREKSAMERLKEADIESFVPLIRKSRKYARKIKDHWIPLISHYVFVRINNEERVKVLKERDVIDFIKFEGRMAEVREDEIAIMKRVVGQQEATVEMSNAMVGVGQEVEIIHGQLTGLRGYVEEERGKKKFVVGLYSLGLSLRMEVPQSFLTPLR